MSDISRGRAPMPLMSKLSYGFIPFLLAGCLIGQVSIVRTNHFGMLVAFLSGLALWIGLLRGILRCLIPKTTVVLGSAACFAGMISFAPATSKDVNSYVLYGRMISRYGVSPYSHVPRDFPFDAWFSRVSYFWSDTASVYGPAFSAISAGLTEVAGDGVFANRLAFQLLGVASLIVAIVLASRSIGTTLAIPLVGLNPLVMTFGLNDAHCDLLAGTLVLCGVLTLTGLPANHDPSNTVRVMLSAIALSLAFLVKISMAPALVGAFVWLFVRNKRDAIVFGACAFVFVGVIVAVSDPVNLFSSLFGASSRFSRFSIWHPLQLLFDGDGTETDSASSLILRVLSLCSLLSVFVVGVFGIWKFRRNEQPAYAVVVGLVAYQILGAYVLSWYALWSLLALLVVWRSRLATVAFVHGCLIAIAYLSGYAFMVALAGIALWCALRVFVVKKSVMPWCCDGGDSAVQSVDVARC